MVKIFSIASAFIVTLYFSGQSLPAQANSNQKGCSNDQICVSALICSGLNKIFENDEESFTIAKKATHNDLTKMFCVFKKGLVLPKIKITMED